jgi:hypothetical protein
LNTRLAAATSHLGEPGSAAAAVLASLGDPIVRLNWVNRRPAAWTWFTSEASADALSHEALDALEAPRQHNGYVSSRADVEFLRAVLVAAEVLEPRSHYGPDLTRWANEYLADVPARERWVLLRFFRERLLPTVERSTEVGKATINTKRWAMARLRIARKFLEWLRPHGGLEALNRALLDRWLRASTTRYVIRDFIKYAIRTQGVDLPMKALPQRVAQTPGEYIDEDDRAALAARFLAGDGIPPLERFAGAMVVLYGQQLTRIAQLRVEDVRLTPPQVQFGRSWLAVPEPLDEPLAVLLEHANALDSEWLLPGIRPRQHLSDSALGDRLAPLGVDARTMRNSALFHIAGTVQPHSIERLLGLHRNTAAAWVQVANGVYSAYWGSILDDDEDDWVPEAEPGLEAELLSELGLMEDT